MTRNLATDWLFFQRCHRLGKQCEPARKRKAETPPPHQQQPPQKQRLQEESSPALSSRLEEKLDSLVSLLRSQATEQYGQSQGQLNAQLQQQLYTPQSQQSHTTPKSLSDSTSSLFPTHSGPPNPSRADTASTYNGFSSSYTSESDPHLVFDAGNSVIRPVRPTENDTLTITPIHHDVSKHFVSDQRAEERLNIFRHSFLPTFPFVHIPNNKSARELRQEKPFLWFVIMCLTNPDVSEQFVMADIVWDIISRRIVTHQLANLDLLLGVVCFGAW